MKSVKASEIIRWLKDGLYGWRNGYSQDLVCAVELVISHLKGKVLVDEAELQELIQEFPDFDLECYWSHGYDRRKREYVRMNLLPRKVLPDIKNWFEKLKGDFG